MMILVLFAFAAHAYAGDVPQLLEPDDTLIPPLRFQTGTPIAPIHIYTIDGAEVQAICADHAVIAPRAQGLPIAGCALFTRGSDFLAWPDRFAATECSIFVRDRTNVDHALVVSHEEAHCRGWPPDHPL